MRVRPLRQGRGHHGGFGGAHRDEGKDDLRALQPVRRGGGDIAFGQIDLRAHLLQRVQMQFHRPGPDGAAAGQRYLGLAHAGDQRPQDLEARPHLADHVVGGEDAGDVPGLKAHGVALAELAGQGHLDIDPESGQQLGHGPDVRQPRHVGQGQGFGRQQRRRHQLQGGILGAADGDFPFQRVAAADPDAVHDLSNERKRGCSRGPGPRKAGQKAGLTSVFQGRFGELLGRLRRPFGAGFWRGLGSRGFFSPLEVGPEGRGQLFRRGSGHRNLWGKSRNGAFLRGILTL